VLGRVGEDAGFIWVVVDSATKAGGLLLLEECDAWPGKADEAAGFFWVVVCCEAMAGLLLLEECGSWHGE